MKAVARQLDSTVWRRQKKDRGQVHGELYPDVSIDTQRTLFELLFPDSQPRIVVLVTG